MVVVAGAVALALMVLAWAVSQLAERRGKPGVAPGRRGWVGRMLRWRPASYGQVWLLGAADFALVFGGLVAFGAVTGYRQHWWSACYIAGIMAAGQVLGSAYDLRRRRAGLPLERGAG
jgi:hypothetical protein